MDGETVVLLLYLEDILVERNSMVVYGYTKEVEVQRYDTICDEIHGTQNDDYLHLN